MKLSSMNIDEARERLSFSLGDKDTKNFQTQKKLKKKGNKLKTLRGRTKS